MRLLRPPRAGPSNDESASPHASPRGSRSRFWLRWALRVLAGVAGLVALVAFAVFVLVHSVDRPWLKRRIQAVLRTSAGVDVDYRTARVDLFSGAVVEGLVVASPPRVRAAAPDLLRVGRVDVRWSVRSIVSGRPPALRSVAVSGLAMTVVTDEQGRTSFDDIPAVAASKNKPSGPLSSRLAGTFAGAPPLFQVAVDDVGLTLVQTDHGAETERDEVRGAAVSIVAAPDASGAGASAWRARVEMGTSSAPLDVSFTRLVHDAPPRTARARTWITVDADSRQAAAAFDARLVGQNFGPAVLDDHGVHGEITVRADPRAGRTLVSLARWAAGEGAATADASFEISDGGRCVVSRATGDVDLARLLGWLPQGMVPLTLGRATVRYDVAALVVAPAPSLAEGGSVSVDAQMSNAALDSPAGSITADGVQLSLRARPGTAGRLDAQATASVSAARFTSRTGDRAVAVEEGNVELRAGALDPSASSPPRGDFALSMRIASVSARSKAARVGAEGVQARAHTALDGGSRYAGELEVPVAHLRVVRADGAALTDGPVRLAVRARDVEPDLVEPAASRGVVHVEATGGGIDASLDATYAAGSVDYDLHAGVPALSAIRPFLSAALRDAAPWDRMSFELRSKGRAEHLSRGAPWLRATTDLDVRHPAFGAVAAQDVHVVVRSEGTARRHQADVDVRAPGLTLDGGAPVDEHAALSATVDVAPPSLRFRLSTDGRAATNLAGDVSFDPSRRAVAYEIDGHAGALAPLVPLLASVRGAQGFDVSELKVGLSARGAILGVVSAVTGDGTVVLEPEPVRTAVVDGTAELQLSHFRWASADTAIAAPALVLHLATGGSPERRTVESHLEVGALRAGFGSREVDLDGIDDATTASIAGDMYDPDVTFSQRLSVRRVNQAIAPEYPVGDVSLAVSAERGPEGVVHVSQLKLANGAAGTDLDVSGNLGLGHLRRTLSLTTSLTQDLSRLSATPGRFSGRGKVGLDATVTSPDFRHFHVRASAKGEDVWLAMPAARVDAQAVNAVVPITVSLEVDGGQVSLQRSEQASPYSMLRFADQHPLFNRSGFLSIGRVDTPFFSIAPLVGNLAIEQNVVSLRQFEMGVRGGTITGQCGVTWAGPKSTVELHVRASGVQSSHGEPFDGNIAVAISAADRSIDGRAEILRIGERHLLDLLDLEDPLHVDPAMNRVRTALAFGYPKTVRLVFDHGFASAHIELGGLAKLVSIGELRGIPMGPIVDKMLAPVFDRRLTQEAP